MTRIPGHPRAVGLIEEAAIFTLPARYEDLTLVSFSRPEYVSSPAALLSYMHDQKIVGIILPGEAVELKDVNFIAIAFDAAEILKGIPTSERVVDRRYFMIDASRISEADWQEAIALARSYAHANIPESPIAKFAQ